MVDLGGNCSLCWMGIFQTVRVVPQREVFVVERLGKFYKSLEAGFHILIPFIDKVSYKHTLKNRPLMFPLRAVSRQTTSQ